jgi:hypothetical protein
MARNRATLALLAAALFSVSCSSTRVQTDYDYGADFAQYSTFAWYSSSDNDPRPTTGPNQIVDGRIRRAITENILAKGLSQAAPDKADLLVTYYTSLSSQLRMYSTGWGYGWGHGPYWRFGYGYWPGWSHTGVYPYHEGTIIVDIVDRSKRHLVWRGVITRALGKKSSSEEKIDQAMARVLFDFPPA